jgi:glutamyl-tRNA reductase
VEALTRGLINKVLHQPLQAMKAAARDGDLTVAETVQQIFGLAAPAPKPETATTPAVETGEDEAAENHPSLETPGLEATRH